MLTIEPPLQYLFMEIKKIKLIWRGLRCSFSKKSPSSTCAEPWLQSPVLHKQSMMTHARNSITWEIEAGIQGHHWLHTESEASLGYQKKCIYEKEVHRHKVKEIIKYYKYVPCLYIIKLLLSWFCLRDLQDVKTITFGMIFPILNLYLVPMFIILIYFP